MEPEQRDSQNTGMHGMDLNSDIAPLSPNQRSYEIAEDMLRDQARGRNLVKRGASSMDELSWRKKGRCLGADPGAFYPANDEDPAEDAKAVCESCPVQVECLEFALKTKEKLGVWGGFTARERRRIERSNRPSSQARRPKTSN